VSYIVKLGGGGGSTKTIITSSGQTLATHASLRTQAVVTPVSGVLSPLANRQLSLPLPIPKPTFFGGSLFGGRFTLPQPTGMVQPYRPAITPFPFGGGGSTQVVKPMFEYLPPIANIGGVPVVTQETIKTSSSSSSASSGGSGQNVGLWQGGLLLGPLVLGWLFGTKTIRHRRRFRRPSIRRIRRPSFRRLRRVRRSRRR
jgi:hypothetical protein